MPEGGASRIEFGINHNKPMYCGELQWWMPGPGEVIDGDVIPDPYGITNEMLN